jgi:hypothetical protein
VILAAIAVVATAAIVTVAIVMSGDGKRNSGSILRPTTTTSTPPASTSAAPTLSATTSSSTLPGGAVLGQSCASGQYGYSLEYPDGWHAELSFPGWQCALFDPNPFTVTANSEIPRVAVVVSVAEFSFNSSVAQYTDPATSQLVSKTDLTIDGQPAAAVEIAMTQEVTPLPAGTMRYAVLVDLGLKTLVIETNSVAADDYAIDKHVVLGMAESLTRSQ